MLAFAISDHRTVITLNRQDFIKLYRSSPKHSGIIVCTNDTDRSRMATRINEAINPEEPLTGKLICVVRPTS